MRNNPPLFTECKKYKCKVLPKPWGPQGGADLFP